jgi:thioredoxin reductase (NADPH)
MLDCLIVGAGPAGLTAAIYAARFRLSVRVIDSGSSRAATIPCTRNHAGFPDGISGKALLDRMRRQAERYGAVLTSGRVDALSRSGDHFGGRGDFGSVQARTVLLATGVTNRRPRIDEELHAEALKTGRIRYCPVCDGYEVTDRRVGVIGTGDHGLREAVFLRAYSADIALISNDGAHALKAAQEARLRNLGVVLLDGPARDFALSDRTISLACAEGRRTFDAVYPALGSIVHSDLGTGIGAAASADGCLRVDAHQRTSLPGLYAAGDVVLGLDQISHAMGEAGVAATTIRNDLAERREIVRAAR